jgi:C4-dicarboxylate transporter DctQ subunit
VDHKAVRRLSTVSRILGKVCDYSGSILLALLTIIVFLEVIARYIFHASHNWAPEISTFLMLWLTYFMVGVILKAHQHINIDMLPTKLPKRYHAQLLIFFDIVGLVFAILLCVTGIKYSLIVRELGIHSVTTLATPMWIVRLCVPLGGILLAFFVIERLINTIYRLVKHEEMQG